MKKMFIAAAGSLVLVLGACGGGGGDSEDTGDSGGGENASYDAGAAQDLYDQNCLQCHGENLEGKNGPALAGSDLSQDEILTMIQNGGNGMPANLVEGSEAENLAAWVADQ
ncbi:c-type cytochrome [Salibacterium sp. K-3]